MAAPGLRAGHERGIHPGRGNNLPAVGAATIKVQLAERQHLPRSHLHVVAAEIDALRILRPARQRDVERRGQLSLRECPGAALADFGQNR
jgi:hypothetical protein